MGAAVTHVTPEGKDFLERLKPDDAEVVRLTIHPVKDGQSPTHWAWWSHGGRRFTWIEGSAHEVEAHFIYGTAAEERAGKGQLMGIRIEVDEPVPVPVRQKWPKTA